ncbi:hypothetical protein ACEYXF_31580 [Streptomyces asiaticus]|uniref:hypothetical protein n=1 Tax=Streptomyces asiaticus TaxID=114695 RepID=UPI0039BE946E
MDGIGAYRARLARLLAVHQLTEWGADLVEAVVDRWGIRERRGPGKTVWARITEAR